MSNRRVYVILEISILTSENKFLCISMFHTVTHTTCCHHIGCERYAQMEDLIKIQNSEVLKMLKNE